MVIPALLMLLIQWPLLRRRWLVAHSGDHRTSWPWLTIAAAGLLGLNQLGFEIIASAVRQARDDMLAAFLLKLTLAIAATLLCAGLFEWSARRRQLARAAV